MEEMVGMKEMYDVSIRTTAPLDLGKKKYDKNESLISFSQVKMAQFSESKRTTQAKGGYHNNVLINWEIDKEGQFAITEGVLSPQSWALLSNSQLSEPKVRSVQMYETVNAICDNDYCFVDLKYRPNAVEGIIGAQPNPCFEPLPMGRRPELMLKPLPPSGTKWIFCYDVRTGERIRDFEIYQNRIFFKSDRREVMVDYTFDYEDRLVVLEVGKRLVNGFLKLTGKMSVKGEKSGEVTTAILELPKIKLSSSLAMRLGSSYDNSTVRDFYLTAYPETATGRMEDQSIANIIFLDKELTGDYI